MYCHNINCNMKMFFFPSAIKNIIIISILNNEFNLKFLNLSLVKF